MIKSPIYLIGFPHGGTTLLSRMIQKNPEVIGITKDPFAADEGMNIFIGKIHSKLTIPPDDIGGWKAGLDKKQRCTEADFTPSMKGTYFQNVNFTKDKRFFDKSQSYIVKTRLIQKLWEPIEVYFIMLMRNPYVLAYKPLLYRHWYPEWGSDGDKLHMACKNINECIKYLDEDSSYLKHLHILRFEDLLLNPEEELRKICIFTGLEFDSEMVPQPPARGKWYPVQKEMMWQHRIYVEYTNSPIMATAEGDKMIEETCGDIIKRFKYSKNSEN